MCCSGSTQSRWCACHAREGRPMADVRRRFPVYGVAVAAAAAVAATGIALFQLDVPLFLAMNRAFAGWDRFPWQNITIIGDGVVASTMMLVLYRRRPDLLWAAFLA